MHDPCTVAFDIPNPFSWYFDKFTYEKQKKLGKDKFDRFNINGYKMNTLITVWHVDPETDGSDDSCGYSSPKFTESDKKLIKEFVDWDVPHPYFSASYLKDTAVVLDPEYPSLKSISAGECLALVQAVWAMIAWRKDRRNDLTTAELWECVSLATSPMDNLRRTLARDDEYEKGSQVRNFIMSVFRAYNRHHRPWYKKPKWHVHHWKLQIHPTQQLRRFLFDRCNICKKGFKYGEAPGSSSWHTPKHHWWQSDPSLYHLKCDADRNKMVLTEVVAENNYPFKTH